MKPFRVLSLMAWLLSFPSWLRHKAKLKSHPIRRRSSSVPNQRLTKLVSSSLSGLPRHANRRLSCRYGTGDDEKIRTMTNEGRERQEILDYFVSRYGEWVLLEPKQEGLNWIIWIVPLLVLLLGILWAMNRARRAQSTPSGRGPTEPSSQSAVPESALQSMIRESVDGDDL